MVARSRGPKALLVWRAPLAPQVRKDRPDPKVRKASKALLVSMG
jgi:hypothetical protein